MAFIIIVIIIIVIIVIIVIIAREPSCSPFPRRSKWAEEKIAGGILEGPAEGQPGPGHQANLFHLLLLWPRGIIGAIAAAVEVEVATTTLSSSSSACTQPLEEEEATGEYMTEDEISLNI
ncbi:hypothetical protein EYF80_042911 [Liparis tanakae]|uniref:Uncharacterized protein n=1 Tax=Liparis tanakae TaxID=230148 RepID=A0A4Z2G1A2_9TELE|nr:hypothetical protein EYF80_042911 [Liparis tanakae]